MEATNESVVEPDPIYLTAYTTESGQKIKSKIRSTVGPDVANQIFSLSRTLYIDSKTSSLNIFLSDSVRVEIFMNRSIRLIDKKLEVAATFNGYPDGQISVIHPYLRAKLEYQDEKVLSGVTLPLTEKGRYTNIFSIEPDPGDYKSHRIAVSRDHFLNKFLFVMDKFGIGRFAMGGYWEGIYDNFSMDPVRNSPISKVVEIEDLEENLEDSCEIVEKLNCTLSYHILGYVIEQAVNGCIYIHDTKIKGEKQHRLKYLPKDGCVCIYGDDSSMYANYRKETTRVTLHGAEVVFINNQFRAETRERSATWSSSDNQLYEVPKRKTQEN